MRCGWWRRRRLQTIGGGRAPLCGANGRGVCDRRRFGGRSRLRCRWWRRLWPQTGSLCMAPAKVGRLRRCRCRITLDAYSRKGPVIRANVDFMLVTAALASPDSHVRTSPTQLCPDQAVVYVPVVYDIALPPSLAGHLWDRRGPPSPRPAALAPGKGGRAWRSPAAGPRRGTFTDARPLWGSPLDAGSTTFLSS